VNTFSERAAVLPHASPTRLPVLSDLVRDIQSRLQRHGIDVADMRKAGALELELGVQPPELPTETPIGIERLEGPIIGREIRPCIASEFAWFLDGSQKTLPVWRVGVVPIVVGITVAGILHRDRRGEWSLVGDTVRERMTWIFPQRTGNPDLARLEEILIGAGQDINDPLQFLVPDDGDLTLYQATAGNYGKMMFHARDIAGKVRGTLESDLVKYWDAAYRPTHPDSWLLVDGRLRHNVDNAVGLVKELLTQHLFGDEAVALFSLPHNHRTSAFRYQSAGAGDDGDGGSRHSMWYQRMWPAEGLDARHALIRIEAGNQVQETVLIDAIASWLMAERIPRATQDARWPTLLYPIHMLELMMKRRIAAMTVGWPSN